MQRVECRVDVWNKKLRRKRSQQRLRIRANIRWNLGALPNTNLIAHYLSATTTVLPTPKQLTFFNNPSTNTGNIFKFSEIANCALAPAPPEVMLVLYDWRISTSFWNTWSLLSSNLCVNARSTALLARRVARAIWSAEAKTSERTVVVGNARVITRIRRSPGYHLGDLS